MIGPRAFTGSVAEWQELERAVDAALDVAPAERAALIAARFTDNALREAALAWLRACEREEGILDSPPAADVLLAALQEAAPALEDAADAAVEGKRVGEWRLLRELGRGGMGVVYLAERADAELPLRAALKLMHPFTTLDARGVRRFRDERRFLASLEHPAIARLLDGGVWAGLPWFAMEYVAGAPVDEWCDARRLPVEARLQLFCRVCDAVQHAHARLIVHRDLKPANILVSDAGDPKLLDFGIAKLLADESAAAEHTRAGVQPMTRAYAAPEQISGAPPTTATDVYALGVLLFRLLTGQLPWGNDGALALAAPRASAMANEHADESVAEIAAARGTTPPRLARRLRGDLDTIVARAMDADPRRRYPTADALAADVRRHLAGHPVLARPDTLRYRLRKLVARHPAGSVAALAAATLLIAFAAAMTVQAGRLRVQAERLVAERDKAGEVTALLAGILSSADPYGADGRVPTLREVLDRGAAKVDSTLRGRPEVHAHLLSAMAPAYFGLGDWERAGALAEQAVSLRRGVLGAQHPELAAALVYLANVRLNQGRAGEAIDHAREALAIRRFNRDADTARVMSTLGAALQRAGRLAEAERVLRTLLDVERATSEPLAVAQVARNLAHVLRDERRHDQALPLYAEAYALHRTVHGDEHPETANSAVNLGTAYLAAGQAEVGVALLRHGVETKRRLLGIEHHDVAGDQLTLARALEATGRAAEAARLRAEAQGVLERGAR